MIITSTFEVVARCSVFDKSTSVIVDTRDIILNLDSVKAGKFLFKISPDIFDIGNYKVGIKNEISSNKFTITLFNDEYLFVVKNPEQLFSEILNGFMTLRTYEKIGQFMTFDTSILTSIEDIPDEFEVDSKD